LYESLDERRATTRRWNPNLVWPIAAAAALAIGFVQFRGEDEPEVAETVGMAQDGTPRERNGKPQAENVGKPNMQGGQNPAAAHPVVRVCLEQGGLLQVETDPDGWKNMSLNELGAQLRLRADTHDAEQRKQGKSGWMRHGPDRDVSVMRVLLEVHEDAPWQHTRWVMSVMAQQHFSLLSFVHDNRLVDASLPIDVGMGIQAQKRFLLQVVVFRPSTADGVFGPVEYRWTNRRTNKLEDVSRWMADAVKGAPAGMPVEGRVLASAAAPHRTVAAITKALRANGCRSVEFVGGGPVDESTMRAARLPMPKPRKGGRFPATPPPPGIDDGEEEEEVEEVEEVEETPIPDPR